ncbi:uncharacterized protein LOC132262044 [Phlebotomus argentipes]|uniref:uncharacterized protein LOC132262044 n=1 Tax=Phlebotomus argentipes TaxID=94469 RepID=UPI002892E3A5|nr:uncharacterized protein LOC132262044 [Phlebotomus argentipes]
MGKFNEEQMKTLVAFMTENSVMLQKRHCMNNYSQTALWKDLSVLLNSHGPPFKSEGDWRRSWAKKKFEMSRVKKCHNSYYADLYNLIAKSNEINESRSGYTWEEKEESAGENQAGLDPLQVKKESRKSNQLRLNAKQRKPKTEVMQKEEEPFDYAQDMQWFEEPKQPSFTSDVRKSVQKKRKKSCTSCSKQPRQPEHAVDLFFKSLAMEVKNANLTSENLFTLEWSVLKTVSEKIKDFTQEAAIEVQPSTKES